MPAEIKEHKPSIHHLQPQQIQTSAPRPPPGSKQSQLGRAGASIDTAVVVPGVKADPNRRRSLSRPGTKQLTTGSNRGKRSSNRKKRSSSRASKTLKWHLQKREAEKQEVLSHACRYVAHRAREIKPKLWPMDKVVRGFRVFGDNATIHAAYILATLEWGRMYRHYGGTNAVPILPEDLTTSADLPRQHVQVGHSDIWLNSVATWQWMVDLLQFWTDLSGTRLYGSIFCYPSALAELLMVDINPSIELGQRVTWERIIDNTYGWLNARALFDQTQRTEFERQLGHHAALNDLEKATEELYDCSLQAEAQDNARRAKAEADKVRLLSECQQARKKRQEQAKVTGIATPSTVDIQYPHWHPQPCRKAPGSDLSQPYTTPKETGADRHNAMLNKELGLDNVYDPLVCGDALPAPGPKTLPTYGEDCATIPPIHLPTAGGSGDPGVGGFASGVASPVTKCNDRLLDGLPPGSPMEVGLS